MTNLTIKKNESKIQASDKMTAFTELLEVIDPQIKNAKSFISFDLTKQCTKLLNNPSVSFSNRDTKLYLANEYGSYVSFTFPQDQSKPTLVFLDVVSKEDLVETI